MVNSSGATCSIDSDNTGVDTGNRDNQTSRRNQLIKEYHSKGYGYQEIVDFLANRHDMAISLRQLKRILQNLGLKRRNMPNSDCSEIIAATVEEINGSGGCLGYKSLWRRLRRKYGLTVDRNSVLELLRIIDPEGIEQRSRKRLRRRKYSVPGPNFIWHLDGYDKLKPFGFAIHGCIDGYSRKIIWLKVATSNNDPKIIAHYYLSTIKDFGFVPRIVRSDHGTENTTVENLQQVLRFNHTDGLAGLKSFIKGKSTANQRIESYWSQLRRSGIDFYISFFKDMRDMFLYDNSNPIHVECLRYCFGLLICYELEMTRTEWNRHKIRRQKNCDSPAGKPDYMFFCPSQYGARDLKIGIDLMPIDLLMENYTIEPVIVNPCFVEIVNLLIPNHSPPINTEEALKLYILILEFVARNRDDESFVGL